MKAVREACYDFNKSKKFYDTSRSIPHILRQVLDSTGWTAVNKKTLRLETTVNLELTHLSEGSKILSWRGSRPSRKELQKSQKLNETQQGQQVEEYFNHFLQTRVITSKGHLQYCLKLAAMKFGVDIFDFFPRSWILTQQSNRVILPYEEKRSKELIEKPIWIGKPSNKSRGRGIKITQTLEELAEYVEEKEEEQINLDSMEAAQLVDPRKKLPYLLVVQEYIKNPLLINGYKFDMRLYVLVPSFNPLKVFLYTDGLVRFCTKPYSMEDFDRLRHLTNASIQDTVKEEGSEGLSDEERDAFVESVSSVIKPIGKGDFSKRDLRTFLSYMKHNQGHDIQQIWTKIQNVILLTLLSIFTKEKVQVTQNCFELLGFDILITEDLGIKLVEVNLGPSLSIGSEVDAYVKQPLCEDMLEIIDELVMKNPDLNKRKPILAPINNISNPYVDEQRIGDFELIFPFNKETEELSKKLCNPEIEEKEEIIGQLVGHVHDRMKRFDKTKE
jgi:tubulin polyglutamylase TTLL2